MSTKASEAGLAYMADRHKLSRPTPIEEFESDDRNAFYEIFSDGSLLITSFEFYSKCVLPRDWTTWRELLVFKAGMAYLADRGTGINRPKPIAEFEADDRFVWYEIFSDGSLLFINNAEDNAEDEVWEDWNAFVTDYLLPGLYVVSATWDSLSKIDRDILLRYCDGDESKARELLETER